MRLLAPVIACSWLLQAGAEPPPTGSEFSRLVESYGVLRTLAGVGTPPASLDQNEWQPSYEGAPARQVELSNPHMADADFRGNIYIADKASHSVLKVNRAGILTTLAGTHVEGFNGDGPGPATQLQLSSPNGLHVLPDGTVYIFDVGNRRIRRVGTDGTMRTVVIDTAASFQPVGRGLWVSPDESLIYYSAGFEVKRWTPATGVSVLASGFLALGNMDVHPVTRELYVTQRGNAEPPASAGPSHVFKINPATRQVTVVAGNGTTSGGGDGFPALQTGLDEVRGIAFTPTGGYFLCTHQGGDVWYVDTAGIIHLYIEGRGGRDIREGEGLHPPIRFQVMSEPRSVRVAPNGDLIIVCNDSGYVRTVNSVCPPPLPALELRRTPGQRTLHWQALPGVPYLVERSPDLRTGSWRALGFHIPREGDTVFTDTGAGGGQQFYRVSAPR